jgi:hypothetical protein
LSFPAEEDMELVPVETSIAQQSTGALMQVILVFKVIESGFSSAWSRPGRAIFLSNFEAQLGDLIFGKVQHLRASRRLK